MRRVFLAISAAICLTLTCSSQQSNPAPSKPCTEAQQKQLDFWLGDWDLAWPGAKEGEVSHGTNSIHRILDGCIVQENFSGGDSMPLRGISVSIFEPRSGKWKQTWVDNQGGYLDLAGNFVDGQMILGLETRRP